MQTIDTPVKLTYTNGKLFPQNAVFMGYIFSIIGIFSLLMGNWILALILLFMGTLTAFSNSGITFNPEQLEFTEYTNYFGFIPYKKTISLKSWHFFTVIPTKITTTMYSRSSNYTNLTDYYFEICLLNANYRNKKELVRFESKSKSEDIAKNLASRFELDYFEYNPQTIREAFRR